MAKGKPLIKTPERTVSRPAIKEKTPSGPLWKSPFFWLILVPAALYMRILFFDLTALDDKFFVVDNAAFNQDAGNMIKAFSRGLFVDSDDIYYRPVFMVDIIVENHLFGTHPWGYHLFSLLFHVLSVVLLFIFLKKIKIPERTALLLALLFSVHPVLTQAVAWIPGRNDLLLMIFFLASLVFMIRYAETGHVVFFLLQFIFYLLALLTKETAVFIPVLSALILVLICRVNAREILPYLVSWIIALLIWYLLRATSHPSYQGVLLREMLDSGIARIPAILQYLGKIFFPVNLSAVPRFEDITLVWGFIALAIMAGLIIASKSYGKPLTILGVFWYLLFLLPVLIVPKNLNDQVYEHRLYLPFAGILLVLSQTLLFSSRWKEKNLLVSAGAVILVYAAISMVRLNVYANTETFWRHAVEDSPNSAFAWLNRGNQSHDSVDRERFIRKAYAIDPKEMLVNYWMGINAQRRKKYDSAELFYKAELHYSNFQDLYFNLSRVLAVQKKFDSAARYLKKGIELDPTKVEAVKSLAGIYFRLAEESWNRNKPDSVIYFLRQVTMFDPANPEANHNLAMVLFKFNKRKEAMEVLGNMRFQGLEIPQDLEAMSKVVQGN